MLTGVSYGQFTGNLQGTVQDPSTAGVPSAVVNLTKLETNVTQSTTADSTGIYRFASVASGNYGVSGAAAGFTGSAVTLTLNTGETRNVPICDVRGRRVVTGPGHRAGPPAGHLC